MSGDWSRVDVGLLNAQFYGDVYLLLKELPDPWVVTEGNRVISRSNALFIAYKLHNGVRAAPGGLSPHNYGYAIDVGLDGDVTKPGFQPNWKITNPAWLRLVNAIWKHPRLRSGKWYNDWPHIERLNWKDYTNWRQLYEDNLTYLRGIDGLAKYLPSTT
jgi:hypothetical protein